MDSQHAQRNGNADPVADCREAIALAVALLGTEDLDPAQYKLVAAVLAIAGPDYAGPHIWRLTFKLRSLIPQSADAEVGKGGEVLVEADVAGHTARLQGHGE